MKVPSQDEKDVKEIHDLSVRMKRIFGISRLEVLLKVVEQGNRESLIYETIIEEFIIYLRGKYEVPNPCRFLPIPEYFKTLREPNKPEDTHSKMIITKNMKFSGYRVLADVKGLDYEHSVLALATLARLHAISFCYRKDKKIDLTVKYPVLDTTSCPQVTREMVFHVFNQHPEFHEYSNLFLGQENIMPDLKANLETFGVLCHGESLKESVLFKYTTDCEEEEASDAVFQNLGNCYYGSCVPDLLLFIFSCVSLEIRRNFLVEFIGSVYFDAFKNAVISISKNVAMFNKQEFASEVKKLSVYCGFSALEIGLQQMKVERRKSLHDSNQENVLATLRDVLKLCNWNCL